MDYRHGPIAIAAPGRAVWAFGEIPPLPTTWPPAQRSCTAAPAATLSSARRATLDPMADLILAQRFAVALARPAGASTRTRPRNLTRSVVLDPR